MKKCNCKQAEVEVFYYSEVYDDVVPENEQVDVQDMKYATPHDACVDIRANVDVVIFPDSHQIIGTGLFVAIPEGYEMQVRPRSGLSAKTDLIFKNTIGTIDAGYRNEIFVIWYNLGVNPVEFKRGDRIAQVKIERVIPVKYTRKTLEEIKNIGNDRGGGMGHTGIK